MREEPGDCCLMENQCWYWPLPWLVVLVVRVGSPEQGAGYSSCHTAAATLLHLPAATLLLLVLPACSQHSCWRYLCHNLHFPELA